MSKIGRGSFPQLRDSSRASGDARVIIDAAAVRRVLLTLAFYAVLAVVVMVGAGWLRSLLALPGTFERYLRWGLLLGVPLAAVVAWKYPSMGDGEREGPRAGDPPS